MVFRYWIPVALLGLIVVLFPPAASAEVVFEKLRTDCDSTPCSGHDAVVFIHGLGGNRSTFKNANGFDWAKNFPANIDGRPIDVFRIVYKSSQVGWDNPDFDRTIDELVRKLQALRLSRYRSIGFIAHSLGGNLAASYLLGVKTQYGHPQHSQHGYLITLGTPFGGSMFASMLSGILSLATIDDSLIASLVRDNLYLKMLGNFWARTHQKGRRLGCRPVLLYAGYEAEPFALIFNPVTEDSATRLIKDAARHIKKFPAENHLSIVKPDNPDHPVYKWVNRSIEDAFAMLRTWAAPLNGNELCEHAKFVSETALNGRHLPKWHERLPSNGN